MSATQTVSITGSSYPLAFIGMSWLTINAVIHFVYGRPTKAVKPLPTTKAAKHRITGTSHDVV